MGPPSYLGLLESGELDRRAEALDRAPLALPPLPPGVRGKPEKGRAGRLPGRVSPRGRLRAFPHFGEEPELVGSGGSGTIFMTHCNLRCVFCQNDDISHGGEGREVTDRRSLAAYMIALQDRGCHNINFVTPTHYVAPDRVRTRPGGPERGSRLPLVYNTGGYDSVEVIRMLSGIVDIYMPDYKFADETPSRAYLDAPDYPEVITEVLTEMHRQVGVLRTDRNGIARRGLLIRHLVMPGGLSGTDRVASFIAGRLSPDSYVNIMDQYHPRHRASLFAEISRRITHAEYRAAVDAARAAGLSRGF